MLIEKKCLFLIAFVYLACSLCVESFQTNQAIANNEAEGARLAAEIDRLLNDASVSNDDKVNFTVLSSFDGYCAYTRIIH